jgi:type I restriction enzyme M protein
MHPIFRDGAVAQMTGTGGLQRVPRDYVENFRMPLPPLDVQIEIIEEIKGYQNEIQKLQNQILDQKRNIQKTIALVWEEDDKIAE